ncbi:MAG: NADH-quinone oxidoreductase subunit M [Crenarchaeota archaeon]|nr:NADH-quinone oxidoreductase subunit M [Thermoproteota archaeon]
MNLDWLWNNAMLIVLIVPIIGAFLIAAVMKWSKKIADYIAIGATLVNLLIIIAMALRFDFNSGSFQYEWYAPWLPNLGINFHFGVDGIGMVLLILTGIICFLAAWSSLYHIPEDKNRPLYFIVYLLFSVGILGTFISLNLIIFYLFWELVLPTMMLLIGWWGPHPEKARHAAIKFFIFTFVGSIFMLLGFIYLYMMSPIHTFEMIELAQSGIPTHAQVFAFGLIFIGLAVKLPLFPLHTWLPDAHVEAPAPVSVLLAGLLLKMGGYGFVRMAWIIPHGFTGLLWIYLPIAVISGVYAAIVAMGQDNFKRLVAYTSINHMSYVFFGIVAATYAIINGIGHDYIQFAIIGSVFEMFAHGIAIGLMFLMAGVLLNHIGTYHISELGGLGKATPRIAVLIIFGSLAVFGLPGLIVFAAEVQVFIGALSIFISANMLWTLVILLAPCIIVGTYLWAIRRLIMSEETPIVKEAKDLSIRETMPYIAFSLLIILFGILPGIITSYMTTTVVNQFLRSW